MVEAMARPVNEQAAEQTIMELYAASQLLRILGFSADDIYVSGNIADLDGQQCWGVHLKAQDKEFRFHTTPIAVVGGKPKAFLRRWEKFSSRANGLAPGTPEYEDLARRKKDTFVWRHIEELIMVLSRKGFEISPDFTEASVLA